MLMLHLIFSTALVAQTPHTFVPLPCEQRALQIKMGKAMRDHAEIEKNHDLYATQAKVLKANAKSPRKALDEFLRVTNKGGKCGPDEIEAGCKPADCASAMKRAQAFYHSLTDAEIKTHYKALLFGAEHSLAQSEKKGAPAPVASKPPLKKKKKH